MAYSFLHQRDHVGAVGERCLDSFFGAWYGITPATLAEQRTGIDRIFTTLYFDSTFTVEYKTDTRAATTGNAFIETVSVAPDIAGWALTSQATYLVYYVPGLAWAAILPFAALRDQLVRWQRTYHTVTVRNAGYTSAGLLVRLHELERLATWHGPIQG